MKTNVIAIVPSAGLGKRFNPSARKIFAHIAGIPVFIYTLKRLQEIKSITENAWRTGEISWKVPTEGIIPKKYC